MIKCFSMQARSSNKINMPFSDSKASLHIMIPAPVVNHVPKTVPANEPVSIFAVERRGAVDASWALSELDAELTALCKVIAPLSPQALGFTCAGRRKGVVWMPFADTEESDRFRPQPLTEEDFRSTRKMFWFALIHNAAPFLP